MSIPNLQTFIYCSYYKNQHLPQVIFERIKTVCICYIFKQTSDLIFKVFSETNLRSIHFTITHILQIVFWITIGKTNISRKYKYKHLHIAIWGTWSYKSILHNEVGINLIRELTDNDSNNFLPNFMWCISSVCGIHLPVLYNRTLCIHPKVSMSSLYSNINLFFPTEFYNLTQLIFLLLVKSSHFEPLVDVSLPGISARMVQNKHR